MRRRRTGLLLGALVASTTLVSVATPASAASGLTMHVTSPVRAGVGIDAPGVAYDPCRDQVGANSGFSKTLGTTAAKIRVELYPGGCSTDYDGWGTVGGIHFEVARNGAGNYAAGQVRLPVAPNDGFVLRGSILSSTAVGDGRVKVDTFQVADFQLASVAYGAFASTVSRGTRWSGGVGWAGRYLLFIEDTATGRKIQALTDIRPGAVPTIDLDAICFGFETCLYMAGGPGDAAGTFHPTAPTRILDTRRGLGITNGPVRTGDGRHGDPNPDIRRDEAANHELRVTGRFGVPESGVSAVLLNVTAVDAPGVGYLSVTPKPPRVGDIFNDQGSYGAFAGTSNLNVGSNQAVPNLVLARVGAGGVIRIANSFGPTHVIADIAGWFGTGGAHTNGAGFQGVVPVRALDTRNGIGGPAGRVGPGESRSIPIRGRWGVPANATSVVVNLTAVGPTGSGYATAFPDGTSPPDASNLNYGPHAIRANTAVVKIGANGAIRVRAAETDVDLLVDVLGSFGPYGGRITAVTPRRVVDTRHGVGTAAAPFQSFETRTVQIAGRDGVPADATAVVANLTATNPTSVGYLTAWGAGAKQPVASNLNFLPGQSVPNLVILELRGGRLAIFNERGTTDVIVDVMGYAR